MFVWSSSGLNRKKQHWSQSQITSTRCYRGEKRVLNPEGNPNNRSRQKVKRTTTRKTGSERDFGLLLVTVESLLPSFLRIIEETDKENNSFDLSIVLFASRFSSLSFAFRFDGLRFSLVCFVFVD